MESRRSSSFITEGPTVAEAENEARRARLEADYEDLMLGPRQHAARLADMAEQLNDRMRALVDKERQEFLAAYRAHTKKIQEELAHLRRRVQEEEESVHRDERMRALQSDRDEFRAEVQPPFIK